MIYGNKILMKPIGGGGESFILKLDFNGNANDSSGNNLNGVVTGATLTNDQQGNPNSAYAFDGSGDYITIADSDLLTPATGFIFEIKIKRTSDSPVFQYILYKGDASVDTKDYDILIAGTTMYFRVYSAGTMPNYDRYIAAGISRDLLGLNEYHILSFIYDGTNNENAITVLIDGNSVSQTNIKNAFTGGLSNTNKVLRIGSDLGNTFSGVIDYVYMKNL